MYGMTPETQSSSEGAIPQQDLVAADSVAAFMDASNRETTHKSSDVKSSLTALAAKLPLQLDLRVPLPSFRVQHLLSLEKGQVVESAWPHAEDLPLWSGGVQLVWTEFEVVDQKLAVRVTRLA
jgi:hypothetical protein